MERIKLNTGMLVVSVLSVFAGSASASWPTESDAVVKLAEKVVPSVVNISTFQKVPQMRGITPEELFRHFFGGGMDPFGGGQPFSNPSEEQEGPTRIQPQALGTGFVIDASGLILTNNHVVGDADEIKIRFTEEESEEPTPGEVIGRDPELDIALIQVKTKRKLTAIPLGDSDELKVGEFVIAVGNPFGQGHSVTHGIISALHRDAPGLLARYIQTDTPINPGNSGGPLVNLKGEVIGINNAIDARAQGIGFAIPSNMAKQVLPQLRKKGRVDRGYIGVEIGMLTPEVAEQLKAPRDLRAPFVVRAVPGEPADRAGMKPYDVITEVNGKPVHSQFDLIREVTSVPVGKKAKIKILREGRSRVLDIEVATRTAEGGVGPAAPRKRKKGPEERERVPTGLTLSDLDARARRALGLSREDKGVLVTDVEYGSPAEAAGLIQGDLILEVDRKPVTSKQRFYQVVKQGKTHLLRVRRKTAQGGEVFQVLILNLKKDRE